MVDKRTDTCCNKKEEEPEVGEFVKDAQSFNLLPAEEDEGHEEDHTTEKLSEDVGQVKTFEKRVHKERVCSGCV